MTKARKGLLIMTLSMYTVKACRKIFAGKTLYVSHADTAIYVGTDPTGGQAVSVGYNAICMAATKTDKTPEQALIAGYTVYIDGVEQTAPNPTIDLFPLASTITPPRSTALSAIEKVVEAETATLKAEIESLKVKCADLESRPTAPTTPARAPTPASYRAPSWYDTLDALLGMGQPTLLAGESGCGKTLACETWAKAHGYTVYYALMDESCTPSEWIGHTGIVGQATVYQEGLILKAMQDPRGLLILDELDRANPATICALHSIICNPQADYIVLEDGGRAVTPAPDFRVVATANALASHGKQASAYRSNGISAAMMDRLAVIACTYPEDEENILADIVDRDLAERIVSVANAMCKVNYLISTRRLVMIARLIAGGMQFKTALDVVIVSRLSGNDRDAVSSIVEERY
jgi:cobaltochelatase CobS